MSLNLLSIMDGTRTLTDGFTLAEMGQVVVLGVGIVFFGLICIVALCSLMSLIFKTFKEKEPEIATAPVANVSADPIANKQELIAVISSAIAEEMGADVEAIRIKSIKKL